MDLKTLQKHWNAFAERDALWAILTKDRKAEEWKTDEFFSTGVEEINNTLAWVQQIGLTVRFGKALDFGCGVGRLTQGLCLHFQDAYGIDISPSMIDLARQFNAYPEKCHYFLNEVNNLSLFQQNYFDFIYSSLVLQHIDPQYSKQYIKEFVRILAPGGFIVFQLPNLKIGERLPEEGFQARITVRNYPPVAGPDSQVKVLVTVKNESPVAWPSAGSKYPVTLANRWLSADGKIVLVNDDGRALPDHDVAPGEEIDLSIVIHTPPEPGSYIVELDMVQELIAWFNSYGSATARLNITIQQEFVRIASDTALNPPHETGEAHHFEPVMEMYEVPTSEVFELIEQTGGRVVATAEQPMGKWNSCTYCVTK